MNAAGRRKVARIAARLHGRTVKLGPRHWSRHLTGTIANSNLSTRRSCEHVAVRVCRPGDVVEYRWFNVNPKRLRLVREGETS
jgi:hypothetical protein